MSIGFWSRMLGLLAGTMSVASSATGQQLALSDLPFGFKSAWIAVRSDLPASVIDALGGQDCREVRWKANAERNAVGDGSWMIVSPPVKGWILVGGKPIIDWPVFDGPKPPLDDRATLARLSALSERFEEVHYFGTHRVTETHMWSLFRHGRLVRLFKFSGERGEYWQHGALTDAELEYVENEDTIFQVDEEVVRRIAERWSVDPLAVVDAITDGPESVIWACHLTK